MAGAWARGFKRVMGALLGALYRLEVSGRQHLPVGGEKLLIVANHTSFLDVPILWTLLPDSVTYAIDTHVARYWWMRPILRLARTFPLDPNNPLALKALVARLRAHETALIFPEGRITVTGALMKVYDGPGMAADRAGARVLPIRLEGTQYTPFSRMGGRLRRRWLPKIRVTILPPVSLDIPAGIHGHARHLMAGARLAAVMEDLMFHSRVRHACVFDALLDARRAHGGGQRALEDSAGEQVSLNRLIAGALLLGDALARETLPGEVVGVAMPNAVVTVMLLLGLQRVGRVPALLNPGTGGGPMAAACALARVRVVVTSRRFIARARLDDTVAQIGGATCVRYLEDLADEAGWAARFGALWRGWCGASARHPVTQTAVILFTSGSEGTAKGVCLSHANLLANCAQITARIDFGPWDVAFNALPLFHSFGLTCGLLAPLLSGARVVLYSSPLHYRLIPEKVYETCATLLFGTNTFLSGYARAAHPYDFRSLRYVFAGAEKLQEATRDLWMKRFGLRILEGYGATETGPALALNSPMHCRAGTVGRVLPGIAVRLDAVAGLAAGGRLHVAGPNVMQGYLDGAGGVAAPPSPFGAGWYDTGDVVDIDADGYLTILGRARRFAKVGGEMVSLTAVEDLASRLWPDALHAAVARPDPVRGEQVWLVTTYREATRQALVTHGQREGLGEILLPRRVVVVDEIPVLATGKVDYLRLAAGLDT